MSKELDIWGQQRRLRRRDYGPEELATMTEASTEEDEAEVLTTTLEASDDKAKETTLLSEHLQRRMRRCVYGIRVLMTTAAQSTG